MAHTVDSTGNFHSFTAAGDSVTGPFWLRELSWVSEATALLVAGNGLEVTDLSGVRMFGKDAAYDGDDLEKGPYNPGVKVDGIIIATLDSGYVDMVTSKNKE